MARPGLDRRAVGTASPAAWHSRVTISVSDLAIASRRRRVVGGDVGDAEAAAEVEGRRAVGQSRVLVDDCSAAARPAGARPPRSRTGRRSASRCASAARSARARGSASIRRTASAASPPASEKPNFWSSCAVAMNSWVCASTPTVTRIITGYRAPRAVARQARPAARSRRRSRRRWRRHRPHRRARARRRLVDAVQRDPLGGNPARSASRSSPPEQTSSGVPRRASQCTISRDRNALPA